MLVFVKKVKSGSESDIWFRSESILKILGRGSPIIPANTYLTMIKNIGFHKHKGFVMILT